MCHRIETDHNQDRVGHSGRGAASNPAERRRNSIDGLKLCESQRQATRNEHHRERHNKRRQRRDSDHDSIEEAGGPGNADAGKACRGHRRYRGVKSAADISNQHSRHN